MEEGLLKGLTEEQLAKVKACKNNEEILNEYDNLIVVKSISKSYGVPGLRLGVLASSNTDYINLIKKTNAIWNINSFGEYYLQIYVYHSLLIVNLFLILLQITLILFLFLHHCFHLFFHKIQEYYFVFD